MRKKSSPFTGVTIHGPVHITPVLHYVLRSPVPGASLLNFAYTPRTSLLDVVGGEKMRRGYFDRNKKSRDVNG